MERISRSTLDFLNRLKNNNNREWFNENRALYIEAKENFESFVQKLIDNITDLFSFEYPKENTTFEKNSLFIKYVHNLSLVAINKKIPIIITNMIRNIEGTEMENMRTAIDLFTHIKIKLTKISSKFHAEIRWLLHQTHFSYKIDTAGLSDYTEDI